MLMNLNMEKAHLVWQYLPFKIIPISTCVIIAFYYSMFIIVYCSVNVLSNDRFVVLL